MLPNHEWLEMAPEQALKPLPAQGVHHLGDCPTDKQGLPQAALEQVTLGMTEEKSRR